MESFGDQVASPSWWIGVVVVGIVINVASVYLKRVLDRILSAISRRWAIRTERLRTERGVRIRLMCENPEARRDARFEITLQRMWALMFLQVAGFAGVADLLVGVPSRPATGWISGLIVVVPVFMSLRALQRSSARLDEYSLAGSRSLNTAA